MITAELLRRIRNDRPMPVTIAALRRKGPPAKWSEGYFRFLCPGCGELRATVNPRNNLAHCFCCQKNFNNIDLLMSLGYGIRIFVNNMSKLSNLTTKGLFFRAHWKLLMPCCCQQMSSLMSNFRTFVQVSSADSLYYGGLPYRRASRAESKDVKDLLIVRTRLRALRASASCPILLGDVFHGQCFVVPPPSLPASAINAILMFQTFGTSIRFRHQFIRQIFIHNQGYYVPGAVSSVNKMQSPQVLPAASQRLDNPFFIGASETSLVSVIASATED